MKKDQKRIITAAGIPSIDNHTRSGYLRQIGSQRGARIRALREILNFTTEEFAKILSMNPGTLGRLERGESCLTVDTANMIYNKMIDHGDIRVIVKPQWLLSGQKGCFEFLNKKEINIVQCIEKIASKEILPKEMKEKIHNMSLFLESHAFKTLNEGAMVAYVRDNKMSPIINKGEYVGGTLLKEEDYKTLNKDICIIETKKSIYIVRRVHFVDGRLLLTTEDKSDPQILTTMPSKIFKMCWRRINDKKTELLTSSAEDIFELELNE